jgi:putative transposase
MAKKKVKAVPLEERRKMMKKEEKLSIYRQSVLLGVHHTNYYYRAVEKEDDYSGVRHAIVDIWNDSPARGARHIRNELRKRGYFVSRKKVGGLMKELKIKAVIYKRNLSKPNKKHKKYPYLLRGVKIVRPNQVWSTDITYINLEKGYVYLVAIIDWYSRKVLSWRLSNSLSNSFCIDALNEALVKYGKPEIFNTDQGSQFTAENWIKVLEDKLIKISMDGKGRALDNVYIERLWRTVKYEHVFAWSFDNVPELKESLKGFFYKYNNLRGHQSLNEMTPNDVYYGRYYEQEAA